MDLVEEIAQHLHQTGWTGKEDNIYWMVRNEFVERSDDIPAREDIRAAIERLKELSAQNSR